ncbi:MAG: hypothetical protein U1F43_10940 [Myxococcota bacterium]
MKGTSARARTAVALAALVGWTACDALSERPGATSDATIVDTAPPPESCSGDGDCDDGHACTVDRCLAGDDGVRHCAWSVADGMCFANNVCAAAGELRGGLGCEVCDPAADARGWTRRDDGASCDDGDACTTGETCAGGECTGQAVDCDDDNPCTREVCDRVAGCVVTPVAGQSCDDGVRCTVDDRCDDAGRCGGQANSCDDGDPCTVDACSELAGCSHVVTDGLACEDGDACSDNDTCQAGTCTAGGATNCDDGNTCTVDHCDAVAGCVHLPTLSPCCLGVSSVCDDQNPCTDDQCDALTGACSYAANRASCDDGDPCTLDDVCADLACTGGRARDCDDHNPCTDDTCAASFPATVCTRRRRAAAATTAPSARPATTATTASASATRRAACARRISAPTA